MQVTIRTITDANGSWINAEDLVDALQMRAATLQQKADDTQDLEDLAAFEAGEQECLYVIDVVRAACPKGTPQ